jgi:hypothetical protein
VNGAALAYVGRLAGLFATEFRRSCAQEWQRSRWLLGAAVLVLIAAHYLWGGNQ